MPAPGEIPLGAPVWNDLATDDLDASIAFYSGLFGWEHTDVGPEPARQVDFTLDGAVVAGATLARAGASPAWTVCLRSDDAAATLDAAVTAGGAVLVPAQEALGRAVAAQVRDPSGAVVGVWEGRGSAGFGAVAEFGAPAWHELLSTGYRAAVDFYVEVFGWSVSVQGDSDDFRYCVDQVDGDQYAGIMDASRFLPEGTPSHWSVYFLVEDADEAAARAVELGGAVSMAPEDSPYGRMAVLVDPRGAQLKIIAPADGAA